MKEAWIEIRKLITVYALGFALWAMPESNFKTRFSIFLRQNILDF